MGIWVDYSSLWGWKRVIIGVLRWSWVEVILRVSLEVILGAVSLKGLPNVVWKGSELTDRR